MRVVVEFILGFAAIALCVTLSHAWGSNALFMVALFVLWPTFLARVLFLVLRGLVTESRAARALIGAAIGPVLGVVTGFPLFFFGGLWLGFVFGLVLGPAVGALTPDVTTEGV